MAQLAHIYLGSERMTRLQQVQGHLMLGCLDGAQETRRPILSTPPEHRVRPLLLLLDKVRRMGSAPALAAEPIVGTIQEAIVAFQRDTAIKELN